MASPVPERASASPTSHDPAEAAIVANQATTIIEADEGFEDGYQTNNNSTTTTSLSSSVRDYTFENGRRYHKFREGRYTFPNDEGEQEREDMKHAIIVNLCSGKLHFAPIRTIHRTSLILGPTREYMGDKYPSAQVPPNVKFLVDDAESPWITQEDFYNLVHGRHITPTIKDFPTFIQRAFKHIKPGGWLEALNVNLTTALEHTLNLKPYGFTNIHHQNKTLKTVGLYIRTAVLDGLDAMSFGPLLYLVDVKKCLINNSIHSYFPFHVSYKQKTENETKDK
ncbi:hypothetical protein DL95DRAFT_504610 [Leptodontidium sp. 2 PMI_412]|nr:hypothetical protein DL95DRAFT_504610 [Leptodontidium sp. 2 PMI_412]